MNTASAIPIHKTWTASELRGLPEKQRSEILQAAAAMAEEDYKIDAELTTFEAFGKGDLYGDSSNTETRRSLAH